MNQTSDSSPAAPRTQAGAVPLQPHRIALICSSWHSELVAVCKDAFLSELERHAWPPDRVDVRHVPGAFEIPMLAKRLALTGRYDAIVACALVVNGGIYRHEFVAAAVIDALMHVQLDCDVPVLSAVLTPRDFHEHEDHRRFFAEHLAGKGKEVARACVQAREALSLVGDLAERS